MHWNLNAEKYKGAYLRRGHTAVPRGWGPFHNDDDDNDDNKPRQNDSHGVLRAA